MAIHETVSAWEGEINDVKRRVRKSFIRVHSNIVSLIANRIVDYTPIDTGRAVGSWKLSIGYEEGDTDLGPGEYPAAKEFAKKAIADVVSAINEGNMFEKVYFNNTVPYIEALEHGHSDQAPAGMVRLALAEVRSELRF
jgi:hypothetical protein